MSKKFLIFIVLIAILGGVTFWIANTPVSSFYNDRSCPFCEKKVIEEQLVYEGDLIRVLYNYKPLFEGHILIIPKRHIDRFEKFTDQEVIELKHVVEKMQKAFEKAYQKSDYVLILQNGPNAGQTVAHTHFHMIPRGKESVVIEKALLWQAFLTDAMRIRKPLSKEDQREQINKLKRSLE